MEIELDFILNYAVSITDRLVSLYRCHGSKWIFVRNATLSEGASSGWGSTKRPMTHH